MTELRTEAGRELLTAIEDDLDEQQDGTAAQRDTAKRDFRDAILAIEAEAAAPLACAGCGQYIAGEYWHKVCVEAAAPSDAPSDHIYYCQTCGKTRMVEWLHRDCPPDVHTNTRAAAPSDAGLEYALRESLTDDVMRQVLIVLPAPNEFAGYFYAVRERLIVALARQGTES